MLENTGSNERSSYPLYGYDTGVVQRILLPLNTREDREERTCQTLFIHLRDQIVSNLLFSEEAQEKKVKRIPGSRKPTL